MFSGTNISPRPEENVRPLLPDPLAGLQPLCTSSVSTGCISTDSLPTPSVRTLCPNSSDVCILSPGKYNGIRAGGGNDPSTILLRPGIYLIQGRGLQLGSHSRVLAIPSTLSDEAARTRYASTDTTVVANNWQADCPAPPASSTCGVLIYNAPGGSSWTTQGTNSDLISAGAQGNLMLRAYKAGQNNLMQSYNNMVIAQQRTPAASATVAQPTISLGGGACVVLSGTLYAPSALVEFGGGSCGSGGGADDVTTLQFIAFDLTLGGNNNFFFGYRADSFTAPTFYGLVE
jgi:hypothetical protein